MENLYHKRHRDHEAFDEVRMKVVPRYKTSELSGDEWRYSVHVDLLFKGEVVATERYGTMDYAAKALCVFMEKASCPVSDEWIALEKKRCDQVGCPNDAVSRFQLKELYDRTGHKLDPGDTPSEHYRQFCQTHLRRGDGGREDSDRNYEVIEGPGPGETTNTQTSPSAFGGVIGVKL